MGEKKRIPSSALLTFHSKSVKYLLSNLNVLDTVQGSGDKIVNKAITAPAILELIV